MILLLVVWWFVHSSSESGIKQDVASLSPAQQELEQENYQDKGTELSLKVTWCGLEPNSEDPISGIVQSGQSDTGGFKLEHSSAATSVVDAEGTFLTTVNGQDEGLGTSSLQNTSGLEVKGPDDDSVVAGSNHVMFQDPVRSTGRPKTSRPSETLRANFGSKNRKPSGRPYSAADVKPFSSDVQARPSPSDSATDGLRSDFQQQRDDVSKRSNPQARSRPITAVMRRSDLVHTPPQRPTSPVSSATVTKSRELKVTSTKTWLGGGRDLYWEDVRSRPKSGHTPGWREGMPDSMKKRRSKSAHLTSTRFQLSASPDTRHTIMDAFQPHLDDMDVTCMMPDVYPLLHYQPRLASSPASDDNQTVFPPLNQTIHAEWDV